MGMEMKLSDHIYRLTLPLRPIGRALGFATALPMNGAASVPAVPVGIASAKVRPITRWGVLWRSSNHLDGERRHICCKDCQPVLFLTRADARNFIEREYGYIRTRKDLKAEPHGWHMPVPIRVKIELAQDHPRAGAMGRAMFGERA